MGETPVLPTPLSHISLPLSRYVYKARDKETNQIIALKRIIFQKDSSGVPHPSLSSASHHHLLLSSLTSLLLILLIL